MKIFRSTFLFVLVWLTAIHTLQAQQKVLTLEKDSFMNGISREEVQLIDVRTPEEYAAGTISGAQLADWKNKRAFRKVVRTLDKDQPVYLFCASARRSHEAALWLIRKGFSPVAELKDGVKNRPELLSKPPSSLP